MSSIRFADFRSGVRDQFLAREAFLNNSATGSLTGITVHGGNRTMLVFVACRGDRSVYSVATSKGQSLTLLDYESTGANVTDARAEIWYLHDPTLGQTDVTVTLDSAGWALAVGVVVCGRMGLTRGDWYANLTSYTGTTPSPAAAIERTLTGLSDKNVMMRFMSKVNSTGSWTTQTGMTHLEKGETTSGTASNNTEYSLEYKASDAGSVTTSMYTSGTGYNYVDYAIEIVADPELVSTNLLVTADTHVRNSATTTNYGTDGEIMVGESNASTTVARALVKVDLSSVPANAQLTGANLVLFEASDASDNARNMLMYRLLRDWGETTATWNTYDGTNSWGTVGAMGTGDIDSSVNWTNASQGVTFADHDMQFMYGDLTEMQKMIDGVYTNYGWLIAVETELNDMGRYDTRETVADYQPYLELDYYPVQDQANFILPRRGRIPGWTIAEKLTPVV